MFGRLSRHLRTNLIAYTALAVALAGGGAFAVGAVSGTGGEITACFIKKGTHRGQLRLPLKGSCTGKEGTLAWNQTGLPGPAGPPGPATGAAGGSLTGSYPNPGIAGNAVGPSQIANPQRAINLPVSSFTAEDTANQLDFSATDGKADLIFLTSNLAIEWDGTSTEGGLVARNAVFASFIVPPEYASGGEFRFRVAQDATSGVIETFGCAVSINGGSFSNSTERDDANLTAAALTEYVLQPRPPSGATYSTGALVGVQCDTGPFNHNDSVRLLGGEFVYDATQ